MTKNFDHYITRNIRSFYKRRLFSPILYLLISLVLWLIFPLGEMLAPLPLKNASQIEDVYEAKKEYVTVTFENLTFTEKSIPESPQDIMNAIKEKDDLSTPVIWSILKRNPNMPQRARCIYETVFFYRIAFPWASFLAVFLGIPLAAKNERTGSMLAIISAIVLIVIYIIVAQIFLMLGKSGSVNPLVAGLAPTIAFIIAGAWRLVSDRN